MSLLYKKFATSGYEAALALAVAFVGLALCATNPDQQAKAQDTYASRAAVEAVPAELRHNRRVAKSSEANQQVDPVLLDMDAPPLSALNRSISVRLQDATVEEALEQIVERGNVYLAYLRETADVGERITFHREEVTVWEALHAVLKGTELRLVLSPGGQLILTRDADKVDDDNLKTQSVPLLYEGSQLALRRKGHFGSRRPGAQKTVEHVVRGVVTEAETGDPIPGVNIVVEGTTVGTTTNAEGQYELTVPSEDEVLVFSYVGYLQQEVPINQRDVIDVEMEMDVAGLEEVVVVGYGEVERRDMTGSVSDIGSSEIAQAPVVNPEESLRGRMAGVRVTQNSGAPGSRIQIRVRGNNSILGSSSPLYVVNGIPITGNIEHINQSDIESISVLKDASATAIYGARGANGVVLVNTKQGADTEQNKINISSSVGIQTARKRFDMMNARQFAEMANRLEKNRGNDPVFDINNVENKTDWQDEVLKSAPMYNQALSFQGGDESTQYYVSGSYQGQQGIVIGSNTDKGKLNVSLDQNVGERVQVSANLDATRSELNQVPSDNATRGSGVTSGAWAAPPMLTPYNDEDVFTNVAPYGFSPNVLYNPVAMAERHEETLRTRMIGSVTTAIEVTEQLEVSVMGSSEQSFTDNNYYSQTFIPNTPAGYASTSTSREVSYLLEATSTYQKTIRHNDQVDITGGFTWQEYTSKWNSQSATGFATDLLLNNDLSAGQTQNTNQSSVSGWTILSWLTRVNYSLNDRFLFTATVRADGSSRFGDDNKWGVFPSGAFSWRMSEEPFIEKLGIFTELRPRISYGRSGSTALSPYQSLNRLGTVRATFDGADVVGFAPASIANPALRWETTDQLNIGLEMAFLESRLRATAEVYDKRTKNLLANIPLPPSTGFTSVSTNLGEVRNRGVELSVGADILRGTFGWGVDAQVAHNKNEVVDVGGTDVFGPSIDQPFSNPVNIVREGESIGMLYGYLEDGLDNEGFISYKDIDNDGEITDEDRTIIGDPYPDITYGMQSNMYLGDFTLDILIEGVYGNDIFWATAGHHANSFNRGENQFEDVYHNHWREEDPDPNAKYPRVSPEVSFNASDRYIKDGSYFRLGNVRIMYNVPISSIGVSDWIDNMEVYVSGQNMVTITGYPGLDPEVNTRGGEGDLRTGIDEMGYPSAKTYTFGVNVGL